MKLKNFFLLAIAGSTLVACNETDNELPNINNPYTITSIQSGNDEFATTRFNSLTGEWENGDAIGVYMLDETNTTPVNEGANVQFITTDNAATVKFTTNPGIEIADQNVNFYGYYPYNPEIAADFKYPIDLSDQSAGFSAYDVMWAKKTQVTKESLQAEGLSLTFEHKLVLLVVNIASFPQGITSLTEVLATGINTTAELNLVSGELIPGNAIKTLNLYPVDNNTYAAIILPTETPEDIMFTFLADGRKFQYNVPASVNSLKGGFKYVFNMTLGSSGSNGSLTEIEGGTTPWGDGDTGYPGTGTEVPNNPDIPADYSTVLVTPENIASVLKSGSGKMAFVFNAATTYPAVGAITIPETVTELLFIGEGETQAVLSIEEITWKNLQRVALKNLKITGDREKYLLYNQPGNELAEGATVEINNCNLSTMKAVCGWDNNEGSDNVLASFIVENSQMTNMSSLFDQYRTKHIEVTNSTLFKMNERAIYPNTYDGAPQPTVIVASCTLVDLDKTPIEANSANGNMTYKNNISACTNSHRNLAYKMNIVEFAGNYAAAEEDAATQVHNKEVEIEGAWVSVTMTREELFTNAAAGDFTTTVPAGDPRWRK